MTVGRSRPLRARSPVRASAASISGCSAACVSMPWRVHIGFEALQIQAQRRAFGAGARQAQTMREPSSKNTRSPWPRLTEPSTGSV
jgi:hypothetical protein